MTSITDRQFILILLLLGLFAAPASMFAATVTKQTAEARPARAAMLTERGYAHANWLVDATWLQTHLNDSNVKVIALAENSEFKRGHIPRAAQINWTELALRHLGSVNHALAGGHRARAYPLGYLPVRHHNHLR